MVCYREENTFAATVNDSIANKCKIIQLSPLKKAGDIINEICRQFNYSSHDIDVTITTKTGTISLHNFKEKSLQELGVNSNSQNTITVSQVIKEQLPAEDDMLLGASASPVAGDMPGGGIGSDREYPEMLMSDEDYGGATGGAHSSTSRAYLRPVPMEIINYVGLVNQAMTCYLNSLLQALYMTPEFRNALYNWEFDGVKETRSIPYQLQKLFLNLQTSKRSAVETTDLTTSFGWHGSDAWQQHDIQELCRVMFDALEKKFADTKQANLINDLYEGKMLDYVKCLECGTEKSREDTFLDIPLPVRPFGSNVAYNSVEEALRGFVQPETLDGNNQYHCEKCNKKCDAHKGLKFTKFPYLLTLHLKRFDFDYNTMHRIKLNDKVVFQEKLNLNSFIQTKSDSDVGDDRDHGTRCDDCSTTDSGSALDDESCQGTDASSTINGQDDNCGDSDEGIDVSSGTNLNENDAKGPYVYELFSIMIHSGSASGGHYYAYIKDFDKNQWFCFNDQSVTKITEDDIRKTYGGGPVRSYYSGVYSSSTNAYMLMYRQIDKERNIRAMSVEQFPSHIQQLLQDMHEKEEQDRRMREKEKDIIKLNMFCYHPVENVMQDYKITTFIDSTLGEACELAHLRFKLNGIVALDDCRIVTYNRKRNCIDCSFESDELKFCDIESKVTMLNYADWMLEIRAPGNEFETFKQGGINLRVHPINLDAVDVEDPLYVRVNVDDTVRDFRVKVAKALNRDLHHIKVALDVYYNGPKILTNDNAIFFDEYDVNCLDYKLFVSDGVDDEAVSGVSKFQKILMKFGTLMIYQVLLPDTDMDTLDMLSIPSLDMNQNHDPTADRGTNSPAARVSPQPGVGIDGFGDQSNSEDSSLSDSDRTLVGEAPGECPAILSSNSNSPADQHMASPIDPAEDTYNYDVLGNAALDDNWPSEQMIWDDGDSHDKERNQDKSESYRYNVKSYKDYYFRLVNMAALYPNELTENQVVRSCTVHLDGQMTLRHFKQHLEPVLKVPMAYFKVYRRYHNTDEEWSRPEDQMKVTKDDDPLLIKLGRVQRNNEFLCKVYYFKPDSVDHTKFLFERFIVNGQTVGQVKKEILNQAQKQSLIGNIPYNRCRLREKSWKRPRKVYLDDQKFNADILTPSSTEIYLQELNEPEKVTSADQLVLFVRQWCPSTLTLKPFQEVVLDSATMDEFKKKISEISAVPAEFVEVALLKQAFPSDINVLTIQKELDWNPNTVHIDQYPLTAIDGTVFFYRDSREAMKELTEEEKKEITLKENSRLGKYSAKTFSPGRETALKIYLDASPCKTDDNCLD